MAEAHERARKVLEAERDMLDTLAYLLLKKETSQWTSGERSWMLAANRPSRMR